VTGVLEPSTFSVYGKDEPIEVNITSDTAGGSGSFADVTGGSTTVTAGTWGYYIAALLEWKTTSSGATVQCQLKLTDSSNSEIGDSSAGGYTRLPTSTNERMPVTQSGRFTVTSSDTVKLRLAGDPDANDDCTFKGTDARTDSKLYLWRIK
jgi:hypothetical protein